MVRNVITFPRIPLLAAWLVCAVGVIGCSKNPEPQFAWRETTLELLPEARRELQKSILEGFGTPDRLVAWERMPVDYGGHRGTVMAPEEDQKLAANQVQVEWAGEQPSIQKDDSVLWVSGPAAGGKSARTTVTDVSADGRLLTLAHSEGAAPDSQLVVNFGTKLQLGRMVYMKNCMHCHGVAGDGAGPTARYLNPLPRDYRLGVFKFTETLATERVTRHDLWRVVKYGIPGTYMPSFLLMDDDETDAVVEYVRWLAMRGEMEKRMVDELADYSVSAINSDYQRAKNAYDATVAAGEKPDSVPNRTAMLTAARKESLTFLKEDFADTLDSTAEIIADNWQRAEDPASVIVPSVARVEDTAASRANGRLLYLSDRTKCYTCHGMTGSGNGAAVEDFWPKPGSTEKYDRRGLHDVWGHVLPPRNLRLGQYRGGRRPVDVFRRVYAGIKGTPMPAFGGTVLKDEEIWDLVNFVMSLPYEEGATPTPAGASQLASRPGS